MKGIKQANPLPLPPPKFPCFLLGRHTSQMTSPRMRRGGITMEDRGLVTYVWASGIRRRLHNAIRRFAVPPAHSRTTTSVWVTHTKGGDGARSAGPKKWEGREAMASVELRWRLDWCGLRRASRGEQVCQFNSLSLGLHKGRPSYKEAFSFQKRTTSSSQHEISEFFSTFCGTFLPSWIQIRIPNTDLDPLT